MFFLFKKRIAHEPRTVLREISMKGSIKSLKRRERIEKKFGHF